MTKRFPDIKIMLAQGAKINFDGGMIMLKKILCLFIALFVVFGSVSSFAEAANEKMPDGYWNISYPHRFVVFASDGGSYIRPLCLPKNTAVNLLEYIPNKEGYIFDGWYSDPRTKEVRVGEITLTENITVYAKWIDDGTPKLASLPHGYASNEEIMQYGNYIDAVTGAPVTALWMEQRARLDALMQEYNAKFNS